MEKVITEAMFSWSKKTMCFPGEQRVGKMEKRVFGCRTASSVCPIGEVHVQTGMRNAAEKNPDF